MLLKTDSGQQRHLKRRKTTSTNFFIIWRSFEIKRIWLGTATDITFLSQTFWHIARITESNKTNSNNSVYRLGNLLFESERYKIKKICVKNWWFTNTSSYKKRIINQGIFWGHMVRRAWLIRGYVKKKWVEYLNPKETPFLCRNQNMMRVIIRHGERVVVFAGR